jgi:hypothetical protein
VHKSQKAGGINLFSAATTSIRGGKGKNNLSAKTSSSTRLLLLFVAASWVFCDESSSHDDGYDIPGSIADEDDDVPASGILGLAYCIFLYPPQIIQ